MQKGATASQVAAVIFASGEFKTSRVDSFYATFLGRNANAGEAQFWVGTLVKGAATDEQVIADILSSISSSEAGNLAERSGSQPGTSPTSGGLWY